MDTQESTEIVVSTAQVQLGSLAIQSSSQVIGRATELAKELAHLIDDRKLFSVISGKKYVRVEGWATLGAMLGVLPREVSVAETDRGDFEAVVELVRANDGQVIGRGSALVGADEPTWKSRPRYARRSMAITRATGKAFRLGFSWIMTLAGYEPTPAEEMDFIDGEVVPPARQTRPAASAVPIVHQGPIISLESAMAVTGSDGVKYGDCTSEDLASKTIGINKVLRGKVDAKRQDELLRKLEAIKAILDARNKATAGTSTAG